MIFLLSKGLDQKSLSKMDAMINTRIDKHHFTLNIFHYSLNGKPIFLPYQLFYSFVGTLLGLLIFLIFVISVYEVVRWCYGLPNMTSRHKAVADF